MVYIGDHLALGVAMHTHKKSTGKRQESLPVEKKLAEKLHKLH